MCVVEVVTRVVHHAGVGVFAFARTVADHEVAARAVFEHEGKVLTAGQWSTLARHAVGADQLGCDLPGQFSFGDGVDQHRVVAPVVDGGCDAHALGVRAHQGGDALLQQVAHGRVQRSDAELQPGRGGDDIVGLARNQRADGDDGSVLRVDVARDDGLQRHHHAGCRHHRVLRTVGHGAMTADPCEGDRDVIARSHGRAFDEDQLSGLNARHVVHGKDRVARELLKQALFDHQPGTTRVLFGGLEDEIQRS
jgi:hypothetical protein